MAELNLPTEIHVGDTLKFTDQVPDYPVASGWTLKYSIYNATNRYTITASGSEHAFNVAMATTLAWVAADYQWSAFVENGSERYTVGNGAIKIRPNVLSAAADQRSHVEKVLTALEAMLEGKASRDHAEVTINGRSITRMPIADLLKWRDKYRAEYRGLLAADRLARGEGLASNQMRVRFG